MAQRYGMELGHAVAALWYGRPLVAISVWPLILWRGNDGWVLSLRRLRGAGLNYVAHLEPEGMDLATDVRIAAAGPLFNFAAFGLALAAARWSAKADWPGWLWFANFGVANGLCGMYALFPSGSAPLTDVDWLYVGWRMGGRDRTVRL